MKIVETEKDLQNTNSDVTIVKAYAKEKKKRILQD